MKTAAILLLTVTLFFIHAEALRCRQSSCVGTRPCNSITVPCRDGFDHCFIMMKTSPMFTMTRGCIKEANCLIMKAFEPSTRCCQRDLCN